MTREKFALVVDDDVLALGWIARWLQLEGFDVQCASSCAEAMEAAGKRAPGYAIVDLMLPDGSGLDVVRYIKGVSPGARVIVLTGFGSIPTAVAAMRYGAADYLIKPVEPAALVVALEPNHREPVHVDSLELPTLDRMQWEYIQRALAYCDGNISEAARRLGVYRQSLQRMLRRHPPRK